jgi:FKBP-type peptidyl-prolyl cis-trans isomerase
MRLTRLATLAALATVVACGTDYYSGPTSAVDIEDDTYASALGVDIPSMTKNADGVYYKDKTVGTGETVAAGDSVAVWYIGYLTNGQIFDPGNCPGNLAGRDTASLRFKLGTPEIIPGFSSGVTGMKIGGRRLFIVPAELAYGSAGNPPIPRFANLVFDVQVNSGKF